jgi:hypothetical protein
LESNLDTSLEGAEKSTAPKLFAFGAMPRATPVLTSGFLGVAVVVVAMMMVMPACGESRCCTNHQQQSGDN